MLDVLKEKLELLPSLLHDITLWDSLIVNRRKPHTYRVFTYDGDIRICLHRFDPCSESEVFAHPHPWPGAFIVLYGRYRHRVGYSHDLVAEPEWVMDSILSPGSMYEITNPQTWHSVQPLEVCYSVMVNGPAWPDGWEHESTVTTKGKDLEKMPEYDLAHHLTWFKHLLPKIKF